MSLTYFTKSGKLFTRRGEIRAPEPRGVTQGLAPGIGIPDRQAEELTTHCIPICAQCVRREADLCARGRLIHPIGIFID